ncbi:MAG TPA: hypothetical protein VN578_22625 [Candidatus Binatia bacterium]|jgi:hypothetical protein|nr:hypothetical protein [Candidatus Binatia bacterium]
MRIWRVQVNRKAPNAKARALLKKLQALAERGIDGERISAQKKIARLRARFDFTVPAPDETPDLFSGSFKRSKTARPIYSFAADEFDVANSVKWAIETTTKIPCVYRGGELLGEANPTTARRLRGIAGHIAQSFRALLAQFNGVSGVQANDRAAFVMGLYDGMMNETRTVGQRLPSRPERKKTSKGSKSATAAGSVLHVHPYTVAVSLGRQIRFAVPLEQIAAELQAVTQKHLAQSAETA